MTGPFNTINRETEGVSHLASAELMDAMSKFYLMLMSLERQDRDRTSYYQKETLYKLRVSATLFDQIEYMATDRPLRPSMDISNELYELNIKLESLGVSQPVQNYQLPQTASQQIRAFESTVSRMEFTYSSRDWTMFNQVITSANNLMSVGLIIARISALT